MILSSPPKPTSLDTPSICQDFASITPAAADKDNNPNPLIPLTVVQKNKPLSCSQCNYQCSLESGLKRHITLKHKNFPLPVSTPQISSPFSSIQLGQAFKCDICDSIFPSNLSLTKHTIEVHHKISINTQPV